ncbi:DNA-binding protein [Cupriavidus campinensis]|jgi:HEPN domain-containing protein
MTLENLLGLSLDATAPSREQIERLLGAARRNLADARIEAVSHENRFDAAYKAILQCAMAALNARGYRTLTSRPGHHQTALQTLSLTISLPAERLIVLDALRKQRNLSDYSGDLVPLSAVRECIACAAELLDDVTGWLRGHHPQLLG